MKKRVISLMLAAALAFTFTACGEKKESSKSDSGQEETSETASEEITALELAGMDLSEYVTLGDYKDLKVTLDGDYAEDEEALNAYIDNMLTATYEKDETQDTVKKDSIVNIDYLGKKDGVAFDGGAAQDVNIDVAGNKEAGSDGGYIDGFSSGLVGAKVGDVIDCDVTFPENYGNAELAGQAVVFTFTVNYICKEVKYTHEDLTDEYVSEKFGKDTVSDFKDYALDKLKSDNESAKKSDKQSKVLETIRDNCKVNKIPDDILEERIEEYKAQFEGSITDGKSLEEAIKEQYGIDMDEFDKRCRETVQANLETEFLFLAIAQKENLTVKTDEFESYVTNMLALTGDTNKADFYAHYGSTAEKGKAYLQRIYLCNQTLNWCVDNASEQ